MKRNRVEPFWQRLPSIALYPLREAALYTILALTAFSLLTFLPVIGRILWVVMMVAAYKYAFEVLRYTANGNMDPPEQAMGSDNREVWSYLILTVLGVVLLVVSFWYGSPLLGYALLALLLFVQPVVAMSLGMDGSLVQAANPVHWLTVISRIGAPYLALVALLFVFQTSANNAASILAGILPGFVAQLIGVAIGFWGLFATFHLMGYLILQYHEALGFEPDAVDGGSTLPPDRDQVLLDAVTQQVQDGQTEAATERLRGEIRSRAVTPAVHQLYRRLLRSQGDTAALAEHARLFITQLVAENDERTALGVARESLEADPGFRPLLCEQATRLAAVAERHGQTRLAAQLYQTAFDGFPKDSAAVDAGIRAAQLISEREGRDADARTLLQTASERRTSDEQRQRIDALMALLDRVGSG